VTEPSGTVEAVARALARHDNPKHENWWPSYEKRARAAIAALPTLSDQEKQISELEEALISVQPMLDEIIEREGLTEPCEVELLCGNKACEYFGCIVDKSVAIRTLLHPERTPT